jgi:hypothetical protein
LSMSFNDRYKPGPTLDECAEQGISRLRVSCVYCRHEKMVDVAAIRAHRNVPVNYMRWRCDKTQGGCGRVGRMVVNAITTSPAEKDHPPHPIFDLTGITAKPRRTPMMLPRKKREK